jgi:hypothetical protein
MRIARYLPPALVPALLLTIGFTGSATAQVPQDPPELVGRVSYDVGEV